MAGPSSVPLIRYDLASYGVVTQVVSAIIFRVAGLAGQGGGAFVGYQVYVLKKSDGTITSPHAETRLCTAYSSTTGQFTHVAFTATLAVGDAVLLLYPGLSGAITAGQNQVLQIPVTSAANAGDVVLATVAAQEVLIKKVNVRSNGVTTADLTNIGVYAGAAQVVTLIDNVTGARANIAAEDEQVGNTPLGGVALSPAKTVVMTLTGTGVTAVNLTVTIEYVPCVSGGSLA